MLLFHYKYGFITWIKNSVDSDLLSADLDLHCFITEGIDF